MDANRQTGISYQVVEAAQEGNANMQYQLASYLYVGDETKEPNKEQGFRWMQAAAENGSIKAQKVLGLLYTNGQHTPWPEQDLTEAVYWYERAARAGDAEAMYWMYCCYNKGVGVPYDGEQAKYWLRQAVNHGYEIDPDDPDLAEELKSTQPAQTEAGGSKPWEQYDLDEDPSVRPSKADKRTRIRHGHDLQKKSLDMAQDGVVFIPKNDLAYAKSAATNGIIALSISVIGFCVLALIIHAANKSFFAGSGKGAFLFFSFVISVGAGVFFFYRAYQAAYEEAKKNAWFRQTAFYRQYGIDYDRMSSGAYMQYDYYTALEKSFHPVAHADVLPRGIFGEYRGYLFMGLMFGERESCARPDFVIVTEKSLYAVHCVKLDGTLAGDINDEAWQNRTSSGRVRMIPNPMRQNAQRLQIIEKDISRICPWVLDGTVPFYSFVVLGTDVDASGITGEWKYDRYQLLQCSAEELRGIIEVNESKNVLREEETKELTEAMEQIAQEYDQRVSSFGREHL